MGGEHSVEGFGEAIQRAVPCGAGGERDGVRVQVGAPLLDVVVGDRVAPDVQLLELAPARGVAGVCRFDDRPEFEAESAEVGGERFGLGVAGVQLAAEGEVLVEHGADPRVDAFHEQLCRVAVQAAAVGLEVRAEQQHVGVVQLQRPGGAAGAMGLQLRQGRGGARAPRGEGWGWHRQIVGRAWDGRRDRGAMQRVGPVTTTYRRGGSN